MEPIKPKMDLETLNKNLAQRVPDEGVPEVNKSDVPIAPKGASDSGEDDDLLGRALVGLAPVLLGAAIGGAEGGGIGAQAGNSGLGVLDKQKEDRENKRKEEAEAISKKRDKAEEREFKVGLELAKRDRQLNDKIQQILFEKGLEGSEGQKALDKAFAKDYNDFVAQGGAAGLARKLKDVDDSIKLLEKTDSASGPLIGTLPKAFRDVVTPEGSSIQDRLEGVVQETLRQTLGAQFTEKEGERILARTFNPRLSEKENARRARVILNELKEMAKAKVEAANEFAKKGTLKDFGKSTSASLGRLDNVIDELDAKSVVDESAPSQAPAQNGFMGTTAESLMKGGQEAIAQDPQTEQMISEYVKRYPQIDRNKARSILRQRGVIK